MKTKAVLINTVFIVVLIFANSMANAQPWFRGGNGTTGVPFLGSNAATNQAITFGTFGIGRMFIQDNTGPTAGFIGMGNGFTTPQSNLHIHQSTPGFNFARFTTPGTGTSLLDGFMLGINNAGMASLVNFEPNQPIVFITDNSPNPTTPVERMRINANNLNGFIGIGNSANFNAIDLVHMNLAGGANVFTHYTNGNTGQLNTDGFQAGITGVGIARIMQWENLPMEFWIFDQNNAISSITKRAEFTAGGQMVGGFDGFRIWNPGYAISVPFQAFNSIDIWTGSANTTHMRFDNSGSLEGQNNHFEMKARLTGFWMDAASTASQTASGIRALYIFNVDSIEYGRIDNVNNAVRGRWRIGPNPTNANPGNRLEINSDLVNDPTPSGLRFTNLTANSPTVPNQGNMGFLALNTNGDVIYVPGAGTNFVGVCGSNSFPFANNMEFALNNNNFVFSGTNTGNGINSVGVGTGCTPGAKLDVLQNSNNTSTGTIGTNVLNTDNSGTASTIGFKSHVTGLGTSCQTIAGWFEADSAGTPQFKNNAAIVIPKNRGFISVGFAPNSSQTPICFQSPYAASFDMELAGSLIASNVVFPSDSRYKQNITSVNNALGKILKLNSVYFYYDTVNYASNRFESRRQIGVIAQNLDTVLHEVVKLDANGFYSVDYARIVPLLIEGIKELKGQVDSLQAGNNLRTGSSTSQVIELSSDVILYQNMPNPFSDETVINYFIPDNVSNAKMIFYDETGRMIKEETIEGRGNGSVTLKTDNLAAGVYAYGLEINGKIVQTRKMQKVR